VSVGYWISTGPQRAAIEELAMKILVAADGSSYTKRMLAYLAAHDEWLGDHHRYTVVTAVPAVPPRAARVLDRKILQDHYDEEAEKVLSPIRKFFAKQGLQAEFVHKVGPASEAIVGIAKSGKYDLLMMGSHGHGAIAGLVLGSVTTRVLAGTDVPLLIVR
jgi:nucleotide-binding universal stress UspA family protein